MARGLRRGSLAPIWIKVTALLVDLPLFALTLWFAQYGTVPQAQFAPLLAAATAVLGALPIVGLLAASGAYDSRNMAAPVTCVGKSLFAAVGPTLAVFVLLPDADLDTWVANAALALAGAIIPSRLGAGMVMRWVIEAGLLTRRAVVAGGGELAETLIRGLARRGRNDIRLFGIFDDRNEARSPNQVLGVPKLGTYEDLVAFVQASEIDMVIIALPLSAKDRIGWLLEQFAVLPVEIRLSAFSEGYAFERSDIDPLIACRGSSYAPERRLTKRVFDIVFACLALLVLWPVMLGAAIAIRLESPGPVLFRQPRHGYNNRVIEVLKFRSMFAEMSDPEARQIVVRGDPRVTRVGRFLRLTSIDELPQLFNVLRGDLSLVGPRPHAVEALTRERESFAQIVAGYSSRHRLPPGITGWAQVNGWRGGVDAPEDLQARVAHDLYYIENWSLWFDLRILLRTPLSLLDSRSAY